MKANENGRRGKSDKGKEKEQGKRQNLSGEQTPLSLEEATKEHEEAQREYEKTKEEYEQFFQEFLKIDQARTEAAEILRKVQEAFCKIDEKYGQGRQELEKKQETLNAAAERRRLAKENYAKAPGKRVSVLFGEVLEEVTKAEGHKVNNKGKLNKEEIVRQRREKRFHTMPEPVDQKRQEEIEEERWKKKEPQLPALLTDEESEVLPTEVGETDREEQARLIRGEDWTGEEAEKEQDPLDPKRISTNIPSARMKAKEKENENMGKLESLSNNFGRVRNLPRGEMDRSATFPILSVGSTEEKGKKKEKKDKKSQSIPKKRLPAPPLSSDSKRGRSTTEPVLPVEESGKRKWAVRKRQLDILQNTQIGLKEQKKALQEYKQMERERLRKAFEDEKKTLPVPQGEQREKLEGLGKLLVKQEPKVKEETLQSSVLFKSLAEDKYKEKFESAIGSSQSASSQSSSIERYNLSPRGGRKTDEPGAPRGNGKKERAKDARKKERGGTESRWTDKVGRKPKVGEDIAKSNTWSALPTQRNGNGGLAAKVIGELEGVLHSPRNGHVAKEERRKQGQSGEKGNGNGLG